FGLQSASSIFVLFSAREPRSEGEPTMSPFCLIDVASIRDHAHHAHEYDATWHARLSAWIGRLLHRRHA
ncbi:MAG TPA: hypothetical protein VN289_20330, partial [Paraburkholderia sp.]|nr:hypothetical protein [Paraburkholderia sp.]